MVSFTEHLRTDETHQDGFLRADLEKVILKNEVGTVLETDVAVVAELLNLMEVGTNDSSPAVLGGHSFQMTIIIPREGIRFAEPENDD
jgi:hypothetical protein